MVLKRLATWPAIWSVPRARHPLLEKFIQLLKLVCTFPPPFARTCAINLK